MRWPGRLGLTALIGAACIPAPPAAADRVVAEREIDITGVHLGLTPRGNVGVHVRYTPPRPRRVVVASVAVGIRPRIVFGFYEGGRTLASPLKGTWPNDSKLRAGRSHRVSISFCRGAHASSLGVVAPGAGISAATVTRGPAAHMAKERCATRSFITTRAYLHRRFDPPGG